MSCVAWLITKVGCDEDLFGVTCLLCLLSLGTSSLDQAHLSPGALLDSDQPSGYTHVDLGPLELATLIQRKLAPSFSARLKTGWYLICYLLERSEQASALLQPYSRCNGDNKRLTKHEKECIDLHDSLNSNNDELCDGHRVGCSYYCTRPFFRNKYLGHVWAAVQTEILNYRR